MMSMAGNNSSRLRPKQLQAVDASASLVVVRAGAGSGKTSVLVERYLRMVLNQKVAPARILAATFTEKAAAEMKERVARDLLAAG
ncbi:MAG TPA: UvrD-helicase domain-containing protein, partial [bacterium]